LIYKRGLLKTQKSRLATDEKVGLNNDISFSFPLLGKVPEGG